MAKKRKIKTFSFQGFDNKHYRLTEQYTAAVDALFSRATKEITNVASKENYNPEKPFSFEDYPKTKKHAQKIINGLAGNITTVIANGSRKQWLYACQKNDEFVASIMDTSKLTKARLNKMQDRNLDALQSFQQRKINGMDLSQRVWKYVGQYKDQLELGLDVGLGEGRSAQQLSKDVRQNLQDPDCLFRRVRDKRGNLVLSKAAKAFHPGQGVYRSSYKNAMRLTRSEVNMAYRESDWLRWQQLDFVVGFQVNRSNHDPVYKCKICERLVGRYPKWFKFKGWHPQCRCYMTPILSDYDEMREDRVSKFKASLNGTEYKKYVPKNAVTDFPQGFKDWVAENEERQSGWSSTPYFIRDNFVNGTLADGLKYIAPAKPIKAVKTEEQKADIQRRWEERQELQSNIIFQNDRDIEIKLGISKGKEMSFEDANELRGNPLYGTENGYGVNCQSCVVANELRRRGFDVSANKNTKKKDNIPYELSKKTNWAWIDQKTGKMPNKQTAGGIKGMDSYGRIKNKTIKELETELVSITKDVGRYHIDWVYKGKNFGHIITLEKLPNGKYKFYDPQTGKMRTWDELKKLVSTRYGVGVLRVDNLNVNTDIVDGIVTRTK